MPLLDWVKPPRHLLVILILLTLVSVSALAWLGWRVLEQDRVAEAGRVQDRLHQAADRISAFPPGRLIYSPLPASEPEAPDSRSVFIRKPVENQGVEVWQAFLDGSEARKLDEKLDPRLVLGGFRVHPDGRQIAFVPAPAPAGMGKRKSRVKL